MAMSLKFKDKAIINTCNIRTFQGFINFSSFQKIEFISFAANVYKANLCEFAFCKCQIQFYPPFVSPEDQLTILLFFQSKFNVGMKVISNSENQIIPNYSRPKLWKYHPHFIKNNRFLNLLLKNFCSRLSIKTSLKENGDKQDPIAKHSFCLKNNLLKKVLLYDSRK